MKTPSSPINEALATIAKLRQGAPVSNKEMRRAAQIVQTVLAQESERLRLLQIRKGVKLKFSDSIA